MSRSPEIINSSVEHGNVVIPNKPPRIPDMQLPSLSFLSSLGLLMGSGIKVPRRGILQAGFAITALLAANRLEKIALAAGEQYKIVPVEYERSLGHHLSYPWLPADGSIEGEEATGFNEGGPWNEYDALDRVLNGYRARSAYWRPTRDWLVDVAWHALHDKGEEYYERVKSWTGYCMDAAAASYFAPKIEGSISVTVNDQQFTFNQDDRQVVATKRWGGLARTPLSPGSREFTERVINGEPVVVNHGGPGADWWGLATAIESDGSVRVARSRTWQETGLVEIHRYPSELKGAYLLHEDRPEPYYEGNFVVVDRLVGGLIIGTHQLVTV